MWMQIPEESLVAPKEAGQVDSLIQLWSAASWLEQHSQRLGCLCVPCFMTRRSTSYRPFSLCSVSSLILIGSLENRWTDRKQFPTDETGECRAQEPPRTTVMYPGRQLCTQPCAHSTVEGRRLHPPSLPGPPQTVLHTQGTLRIFISSPDEGDIITLVTLFRKRVKF